MTIDRLCIGLVTSSAAVGLDPDHEHIVGALTRFGVVPVLVIWDDPEVNWDELTAVVIRSTWDYHRRHSEFLDWADHVDRVTELHNPAPVVHWNTDKRYLADLAGAGVPVVPTTYLRPGRPVALSTVRCRQTSRLRRQPRHRPPLP